MAFRKTVSTVIKPVVTCHCYNADGSLCAVCPNTKECLIFETKGQEEFGKWELKWTLAEHDQKITAMDWAPKSNQLLTCSEDRNAYVWKLEDDEWKPTLVLVRINRAALCCKWSPNEDKFAVGSGAKVVSVCFFGVQQNWWVSNIVKRRFKSSVVSIAWHPQDNGILACASTDGKLRVISAYIKKVDGKEVQKRGVFGKVLQEYSCGSWVHCVAFSPSGEQICFVGHDSSLYVVPFEGEEVTQVRSSHLPFRACMFLSEEQIVCGGWNYSPIVYENQGGNWVEKQNLDAAKSGAAKKQGGNVRAAFAKFQTQAKTGGRGGTTTKTKHKNIINDIRPFQFDGSSVQKFSTSGVDGRIFYWKP